MEPNTFENWMHKVETAMIEMCGMGPDDLPDYCYHDAWEDDTPPRVCARAAIRAAEY